MVRGRWLLFIGLILLILYFALRERERCPSPDDVWVLSDSGWVCVRPGTT